MSEVQYIALLGLIVMFWGIIGWIQYIRLVGKIRRKSKVEQWSYGKE